MTGKTYTCGICGDPIRARFDGPVPVSELGKPYYEHLESGAEQAMRKTGIHDAVRAPRETVEVEFKDVPEEVIDLMTGVDDRTPTQRELDRSALQLAMYQNRLDNQESGTVLWPDLDMTARAVYLSDAKRTIGALGLLGWAPMNIRGVLYIHDPADSLKMLRETLAVAQSAVWAAVTGPHEAEAQRHVERLGRLIAEIDRQRPLGTDGKHGDLHTASCGCEDR